MDVRLEGNRLTDNTHRDELDAKDAAALRDKLYNATIIERIDVNPDLARFRVKPDIPIPEFEPGQYVALGLVEIGNHVWKAHSKRKFQRNDYKLTRRAYSISCPMLDQNGKLAPVNSIDYLEFYVTLVRHASSPNNNPPALTPRLFCLREGDRIEVQKKITGHYTLGDVKSEESVLMLGTGTGEAPHNAMVTSLLAGGHQGRIVSVTSVRHQKDLAYTREHQ